MRKIIVGSRQSALALTQTGHVIDSLRDISRSLGLDYEFEVKKIVTKGDRILDVTLSKVGGKGLFVKEIEQALLDGDIDMAVHSMKDMPAELPDGLIIGAVPEREDPRDCLITRDGRSLEELPQGAKVGTSSLRRASQLKAARPDLNIETIRGNIDSRLKKLETEGFDAIVLAAAGLHRMGWKDRITHYLSPEQCLPAVGQGALAIECRMEDSSMLELLSHLQHSPTAWAAIAERSYLDTLNGGCQVPIGAYAVVDELVEPSVSDGTATGKPQLTLTGMVGAPDGTELLKDTVQGREPAELGRELAQKLLNRGAERILASVRSGNIEA